MKCPNCQRRLLKPETRDNLQTTGLLLAIITLIMLAGLVAEWFATVNLLEIARWLAALGFILAIIPTWLWVKSQQIKAEQQ